MKTVELFSGTGSFSKYAKKLEHETFTVDNNPEFQPDLCIDISYETMDKKLIDKIEQADIIWMSPPCTTFSMASGNKHWTADRKPRTEEAEKARELIAFCVRIASYCSETGKTYFIENPRSRTRWFIDKFDRRTIWYCQYGDKRAKPTDIWTNLINWEGKQCHNGNKDCHHEPAPRGSKTGTQGLKGAKERGVIPEGLFKEIFDILNCGE